MALSGYTRASFFNATYSRQQQVLQQIAFIVFLGLSMVLLFINKPDSKFIPSLRTHLIDAAIPFIDSISYPIETLFRVHHIVNEIAELREQNSKLRQENDRLRQNFLSSLQVDAENIYLRKLLHVVNEPTPDYISARIIGNASGPLIRSALISAGEQDGVNKGQAVINDQGLVGRVIEVDSDRSRLLLITDSQSRIPVVTSESRERAVLSGNGEASPYLLYLPEDTTVQVGEAVMTSGDGDVFPSNQPIGIIYEVKNNIALVKTFMRPSQLEFVTVLHY